MNNGELIKSIKLVLIQIVGFFCRRIPIKKKVVATTFRGRKYGDNSAAILEKIHEIDPTIKLVWLKNTQYNYAVPSYIKVANYSRLSKIYHYATARVWINTHRLESEILKRKNQLFIETWHGGLVIKKVELWIPRVAATKWDRDEITNTCKADLFISNSRQCSDVAYRQEFGYKGPIWEIGYPRTDALLNKDVLKIKRQFCFDSNIEGDTKFLVYAPTFRDTDERNGTLNMEPYDLNFRLLLKALTEKWGGKWKILLRLHPILVNYKRDYELNEDVIDVTDYKDMQELAMISDAFISDYSSAIFDAALLEKPCFIFATDYDTYNQERGFAIDVKGDTPFPFASSNTELINNIYNYDACVQLEKWNEFKKRVGLCETGHASMDVARFIVDYIHGKKNVDDLNTYKD